MRVARVDAPFVVEAFGFAPVVVRVGQELGDVEADAAGADDRDTRLAGLFAAFEMST
jgi:hypothetical protein